MEVAAQSNPAMSEPVMHKNRLQEHAQRSAIPLPVYHTVNEGFPHNPQFRSTVAVDGATFRSSRTFTHRKEAEQDVAKVALEGISRKIKHEGIPLIHDDTIFCKTILHEYAVKMNREKPIYTTSQSPSLLPVFITTVVFDGNTYIGSAGKNKKEAEQMGARAVIESILGNSNSRTFLSQIIKSKGRLYAAMHKVSAAGLTLYGNVAPQGHIGILSSEALPLGQFANAEVTELLPPQAKKPKEEHTFELISGSTGSGSLLPSPQQDDPLAGSTSKALEHDSAESNLAQCNQVVMHKVSASGLTQYGNGTPQGHIENHSGISTLKGKEVQASLTNDKLPGIPSSEALPLGQFANAEVTELLSPQAKKPKEEQTCELISGSTGSGSLLPSPQQDDPLVVSTSKALEPDYAEYKIALCNQVKEEIPLVGPSALPFDDQGVALTSGTKRSRKNKGESKSKKTRTDQ